MSNADERIPSLASRKWQEDSKDPAEGGGLEKLQQGVDERVGTLLFGFLSKSLVFCEHKSGIRSSPSVHRSHVLCMPAQVQVQFCQA